MTSQQPQLSGARIQAEAVRLIVAVSHTTRAPGNDALASKRPHLHSPN
jgi:hypothetical protein